MPDNRGGAEGDHASALLKAPAEVHIVTGLAVFVVEPTDLIKRPTVECHVAAWDVLGHDIGEEHMAWTAGSGRHAGLHPIFRRRRNVRAAHAGEVAAEQSADEIIEPIRIGHAVAVCVNNHFARGRVGADISSETQTFVFLTDSAHPGMARGDFGGLIGRSIIDEDDLVVGVMDVLEGRKAAVEGLRSIVGANDDGGLRVGG